ncbi:MAG: acyl-[acyl-carrier-protein] thioesterase [Candidatus Symbiothrix sp.]|jgi:acyl-ACP thioesterase|nr:acyl-[acyl-carrier-protein] thioesterase [Candidatus Symbiothrix sp.]
MLSKVGKFEFHIESYTCDFTGKLALPVIGNFILDAASNHANARGFGYEQISKDNVAWVLSKLSIEMLDYPGFDQNLTIETWVETVAHYVTQRCFRASDSKGNIIGYIRSVWAAINMETRRPINIATWHPDLAEYIAADMECPVENFAKIPAVTDVKQDASYSVSYSDIDINCHMNSIKYIEHALNIFDLSVFKEKYISRFEIVYLMEGVFGDELNLYKQDITGNESIIDTKKGEESVCRCRIVWKDKKEV